ncbi:N-acetyl-gamma-glutamyl-phosphate reductase [Thermocrinis minervae]|uniref:N-acetyl-gamma-glutamyl-phosphate reductase n=1 Tax=Thermocrinis minervae TaxID=381751 RepID=A0A1M6SPC7_9AQUI|nr:N-acetyl-gamma-glutamyl-phosphate reductase [Thermocrinis minervae]SHK46506.1 N-acetyl-gamma-glutamyl-phosphate reductase [Thermocrinis minervae]
MEQTLRVCVYGATGYTGVELLRTLQKHPYVKVVSITSKSYEGKLLEEVFPSFSTSYLGKLCLTQEPEENFDVAFLCLPHETSLHLVPELLKAGKRVIDLSGAYRLKDANLYPKYYGFEHPYTDTLKEAVYGLPEIFRSDIKTARLVANPGCYPTATLLGLYPLLKEKLLEDDTIIVDAISGVSGAGRKTSQQFHFPEMTENAFAYSVLNHRHTPEMELVAGQTLGRDVKIRFTPKVVPMSRGMVCTIYAKARVKDLHDLYLEVYREEPFVKVIQNPPMTKHVLGTNLCNIYVGYDERTDLHVIVSAIDNLGKGASLQAVQNMNLMFGFPEVLTLDQPALFP